MSSTVRDPGFDAERALVWRAIGLWIALAAAGLGLLVWQLL